MAFDICVMLEHGTFRGIVLLACACAIRGIAQSPVSLDPNYGTSYGYSLLPTPEAYAIRHMALTSDGSSVVVIVSADSCSIERYDPQGVQDLSFGTNGEFQLVDSLSPTAIAVDMNDRIIFGGWAGLNNLFLMRLQPNGDLDLSFGANGTLILLIPNEENTLRDIAVTADGSYLICGKSNTDMWVDRPYVARITSSGELDASFGTGGHLSVIPGVDIYAAEFRAVAEDALGGIWAGGQAPVNYGGDVLVSRLTATGLMDEGFGTGGSVVTHYSPDLNDEFMGMLPSADGGVYFCATVDLFEGGLADRLGTLIGKLDANGNDDTSFGTSGRLVVNMHTKIETGGLDHLSDGSLVAWVRRRIMEPDPYDAINTSIIHVSTDGVLDVTHWDEGIGNVNTDILHDQAWSMNVTLLDQLRFGGRLMNVDQEGAPALVQVYSLSFITEVANSLDAPSFKASVISTLNDAQLVLQLPEAGPVRIGVLDESGREVVLLYAGKMPAGESRFPIGEAMHLSAGAYLIDVQYGEDHRCCKWLR
jgi:uncharacterized delta-60 repeat protein